ncbi:MAG: flagellar assembly protein A [Burkholderiales bacterium]
MTESSGVANNVKPEQDQVLLPSFAARRKDGFYVDLRAVSSRGVVEQFIERVFAAGARFADLDYELFVNLAFVWEQADFDRQLEEFKRKGKLPQVRLAQGIVPFPEERRSIYRGAKILEGGKAAEYIFEQVSVERVVDDPEAPDGSGRRKIVERLFADFDELVAALWEKGVRFGIDAEGVREAIARDKAERTIIARLKPATKGSDASIEEQSDLLHRDDAPLLLPDGRMDLRHYSNRFPQVPAGTRLFKKIPRVPGVSGWDVQGRELLPATVKDFDIEKLAGVGTKVVKDATGTYVVADQGGFLDIDAKSNQVSVVHKIVHREGVSMRTTGDLALDGEDYEEHGEVQERRVVNGHNMTFLADIFGDVHSDGGRITIKQNISGGAAHSPGGSIAVEGLASRAMLQARPGEVIVRRAEGSLVVADRVRIEHAVKCDIVADEVEIEMAEGCSIFAKKVALKTSTAYKDELTTVTLLLPDLAPSNFELKRLGESRSNIEAEAAKHDATLQELINQTEMRNYIAIRSKLTAKTLTMSPAQQVQWQALQTQLAPLLRRIATLNGEIQQARKNIAKTDQEIEALRKARRAAEQGISCAIEAVAGDTRVHTLHQALNEPSLASLPPKALHKRLHEASDSASRVFSGSSGSFEWQPPAE